MQWPLSISTQSWGERERAGGALNRTPKGPQRGNRLKLCSFCMVSFGDIPGRTEGRYSVMAGWAQVLELRADQWLTQGSEKSSTCYESLRYEWRPQGQ